MDEIEAIKKTLGGYGGHESHKTRSGLTVVKERIGNKIARTGLKLINPLEWMRFAWEHPKAAATGAAVLYVAGGALTADIAQAEEPEIVDVGGDLRLRARHLSNRFYDAGDFKSADARLRLSADADITEQLHVGTRAVADFATDPHFDHRLQDRYELSVDRAFARILAAKNLELILGAQDPGLTGWYDGDIPLVGASAKYSAKDLLKLDHLAAKIAYGIGQPWLDQPDTKLVAVQIDGAEMLGDNLKLSLSANYIDFFDLDNDFVRTNARNANGNYANDFNILNAEARLICLTDDVPIFEGPIQLYSHYMHNFGAEENNDGFRVGLQLGNLKNANDAMVKAELRYIERDAALASISPEGTPVTNFDQIIFIGGYNITDNLSIVGVAGFPQRLDDDNRQQFLELTINYKF